MVAFAAFSEQTIPSSFRTTTAAAGAIATVNSVGNLGGFVGPYAVGFIREYSGSFTGGSMSVVACLLTAAGLLMTLRKAGKDVPEVVAVASVPLQER
jgi:nitrate/nitrite transporter NarK